MEARTRWEVISYRLVLQQNRPMLVLADRLLMRQSRRMLQQHVATIPWERTPGVLWKSISQRQMSQNE